jgi:hypothetical protein
MIRIKLEENIWLQFRLTIGRLTNEVELTQNAVIENNTFMILGAGADRVGFGVDLENRECFLFDEKDNVKSDFHTDITLEKDTVLWGMINTINNAMQQWHKQTPFIGPDVRKDISNQVTSFISKYNLSFQLTGESITVKKFGSCITYEQALREIINN